MRDLLYHGIPAISHQDKYLIYSPYAGKIAQASAKKIKSPNLKRTLAQKRFFGQPYAGQKRKRSLTLIFVTTTRCNLNCQYCYASKKPTDLSTDTALDFFKAILKIHPAKKLKIGFLGGEPTLNFDLIKQLVNFAKRSRSKTTFAISTNGVLSDQKLAFLIKNKFQFNFSIDGPTKIQNKQRPFSNGQKTSRLVEKALKTLVKSQLPFRARTTITQNSVCQIPEIVDYFSSLGVKLLHLEPVYNPTDKQQRKLIPNKRQFLAYFKKGIDLASKSNLQLFSWAYANILSPAIRFCASCGSRKYFLLPNGKISICPEIQQKNQPFADKFIVGHFDERKKKVILSKKKISVLKKQTVEKMAKCRKCFAKYLCSGGCLLFNLTASQAVNKPNPYFCYLRKNLIKDAIIRMAEEKEFLLEI